MIEFEVVMEVTQTTFAQIIVKFRSIQDTTQVSLAAQQSAP